MQVVLIMFVNSVLSLGVWFLASKVTGKVIGLPNWIKVTMFVFVGVAAAGLVSQIAKEAVYLHDIKNFLVNSAILSVVFSFLVWRIFSKA